MRFQTVQIQPSVNIRPDRIIGKNLTQRQVCSGWKAYVKEYKKPSAGFFTARFRETEAHYRDRYDTQSRYLENILMDRVPFRVHLDQSVTGFALVRKLLLN